MVHSTRNIGIKEGPVEASDEMFSESWAPGRLTFFWGGICMLGLGAAAFAFLGVSSLIVEQFVGWLLLMVGIVGLFTAAALHRTRALFGAILSSLISLVLGAYLIFNPTAGLVALTLLISAMLIVQGAFQMAFAMDIRPAKGWVWIAASALFSIIAGVVFAAGLPVSSDIVLGMLLAVDFISTGIAFIALSRIAGPATKLAPE